MIFPIETIEAKDGGILTDKGGFCSKDEDCPKGEICHMMPPPMCGPPFKNAELPKEGIDKISIYPLLREKLQNFSRNDHQI